ncbi:MAG TPA: FlgD immunoglobulin-like domain containing protein [Candidatus Cloacimonadota bacterium]|nr:FlgD immunoglobulin-like domain containing protein [Candidatus Cloacimonadota bacterium]
MNKTILNMILPVLMMTAIGLQAQTSVGNILELWNVRNNRSGSYTQTRNIDLAVTDPDILQDWSNSQSYSVGEIREYTDGYAYYCIQAPPAGTLPTNAAYWTKLWEASKGWEPIGRTSATAFTGDYNGAGYQILNLYINRRASAVANNVYPSDGEDNVGLFGYVENKLGSDTYIRSVTVVNPRVTGRRATGALVGRILLPITTPARSFTVYIERNEVYGDDSSYVMGFGATGGMVGANNSVAKQRVPVVRFSWANITVSATHPNNYTPNPNDRVGNTNVYNPYNIKYGGLVGCNENGITQDSYARGNVSGGDRVGGVAGCTINGAVFRTYSTGYLTRGIVPGAPLPNWEGGWGGIVGSTSGSLPPGLGGGGGSGSVQNSYWLEQDNDDGYTNTDTASRTQTQLQDQSNVATNFPTWDYTNIWGWGGNDNYPILRATSSSVYYRSYATSNWDTASNWRTDTTENGTYPTTPSVPPNAYNSLKITIQSVHTMTVGTDRTIDQTLVNSGGKILVNSGVTLSLVDGTGTDLLIDGEVEHNGGLSLGLSTLTTVNGILKTNSGSTLNLEGDLVVNGAHTITSGANLSYATNSHKYFTGTTAQNAGTAFPSSVWDLTVNNPAGVSFPNNFTVNSVLYLTSGSYSISGGLLPAVNGFVSPVVKYFDMKKLTVPTTGFSVDTNTSQSDPNYIERQWTVTGHVNDASAFYRTKELTFYWTNDDDNNMNWGVRIPKVYVNGVGFNPKTGTFVIDGNNRSIKFDYEFPQTESKATRNFKLGLGNDQTLPVQLSSFTAVVHQGNSVMLQWVSQTENNLVGYRILRSTDEDAMNSILLDGLIEATNTSQAQSYVYFDREIYEPGTYWYWLQSLEMEGSSQYHGPVSISYAPPQPETPELVLPAGFNTLYPNPFNPDLNIRFTVDQPGRTTIEIYNLRGQMLRRLMDSNLAKGSHKVMWDGRDAKGSLVSSGVYQLVLRSGSQRFSTRAVMMK